MPECYAHKKMGAEVYKSLPKDTRQLIKRHLPYFLIGLHGPDILFFYRPGIDDHLKQYGRKLHHTAFREFYENAKMQIELYHDDEKLVYYYGVLCHLYLDARCHPFVEEFRKEIGVTHGKLETEYERYLMTLDGKDPQTYPVTAHIGINREFAHHIAPFYLGVSESEMFECLVSFKTSLVLTRLGDPISRKIISSTMNDLGYPEKVAGLVMSYDASEMCIPAMAELDQLRAEAVMLAREAIQEFTGYLYQKDRNRVPDYTSFDFYGEN